MSNRGRPRRSTPGLPRQGQEGGETGAAPARGWEATADLFIDAAAQTAPARGWEATVERREAEHETETTPASQKTPVMDVSRQARAVSVSFGPRNGKTGAAQVSTSTQNSKTGAAQVSTDAVGAAKRTGGDRRNGRTRPRGRHVPRHHPVDPSPGMPIALETHWPMAPSVDEVSHSRGMHTPLTPHGAARSCSRRVEVLRLERLLDTPAGSLRLTHRKTGGVFAPAGSDPYTW
mgnify:CR=1 FL=1